MIKKILRKIFLIDLIIGLLVTLKYLVLGKVTVQYPEKRIPLQPRFRGLLRLYKDEQGNDLCIACMQCTRACPDSLISIYSERGPDKKLRPVTFTFNLGRCMFCGLCVEACPTKAIRFSHEYELTVYDKRKLYIHKENMYLDENTKKYFKEN
ncbi:MAG: NuoI/complex I 23 kDa subunit family protein [Candidatus Aminicenantia bacterium]